MQLIESGLSTFKEVSRPSLNLNWLLDHTVIQEWGIQFKAVILNIIGVDVYVT